MEGLKSVQNIVAGKGSLPILQNVMIEAKGDELKMTTTDLDISIKSVCKCTVEEEGVTTLPVKLLFTAVTKVDEVEIEVSVDTKERATISAGNARYKLVGMPEAEFPRPQIHIKITENILPIVIYDNPVVRSYPKVAFQILSDDIHKI